VICSEYRIEIKKERKKKMIVVPEILVFGLVVIIVMVGLSAFLIFVDFKKNAPEAFIFKKARKVKLPVLFLHYSDGALKIVLPTKEKGKGNPAPTGMSYYVVPPVGIKFRDLDGTKTEHMRGVQVLHYFPNIPEPISTQQAIAYSQLKDYLREKGIDISGIENIAFLIASDVEKMKNVERAIKNAQVGDAETHEKIIEFLTFIDENRKEIEAMHLKSGIFTYRTVVSALDSIIAYTSANVAHTKAVMESWLRQELRGEVTEWIKYGMFLFLAALGAGIFIMLAT
jgi:hypothetical protein